jgi:DNA-binding NarL/FixJ family response regulator
MSSQLLAETLVHSHNYEASAVLPSELLNSLQGRDIGLVVLGSDLKSRPGSEFDLAIAVARNHPKTAIVILLDQPTRTSVISAFRSGARGVFSRQQPMSELLDCIEHVSRGSIWAGRTESTYLLEAFRSIPAPVISAANNTQPLTARELQVVRRAAQGKTNKAIAKELGLSEHTIKNYLFRTFEKLGVSSRIELLFYLTMQGQIFSDPKADDELAPESEARENPLGMGSAV